MDALASELDNVAAATSFSGVVRVDVNGDVVLAHAYGLADRAHGIANTLDTRFGIASGTKGLTALVIVRLVEQGVLTLDTTARSHLRDDLPAIADDVTVEHLLAHRSGIGDYLDEDVGYDFHDYLIQVPVHRLVTTEDYVPALVGFPTKFVGGERFSYCNGAYVVLALLAERATRTPFAELVDRHVCQPAGMTATSFLRSDELPGDAAIGYLTADGPRTNVLHLPVRGSGDGGIYSTASDIHALWMALFDDRIVSASSRAMMVAPRSDAPSTAMRYGLGFWLGAADDTVILEGCDAGVSFHSACQPTRGIIHTVISNTTSGAWPIAKLLAERLGA